MMFFGVCQLLPFDGVGNVVNYFNKTGRRLF